MVGNSSLAEGRAASSTSHLLSIIQQRSREINKGFNIHRPSIEEIFENAIRKTIIEIKLGANSEDFPDLAIINLLIDAAKADYSNKEIKEFVSKFSHNTIVEVDDDDELDPYAEVITEEEYEREQVEKAEREERKARGEETTEPELDEKDNPIYHFKEKTEDYEKEIDELNPIEIDTESFTEEDEEAYAKEKYDLVSIIKMASEDLIDGSNVVLSSDILTSFSDNIVNVAGLLVIDDDEVLEAIDEPEPYDYSTDDFDDLDNFVDEVFNETISSKQLVITTNDDGEIIKNEIDKYDDYTVEEDFDIIVEENESSIIEPEFPEPVVVMDRPSDHIDEADDYLPDIDFTRKKLLTEEDRIEMDKYEREHNLKQYSKDYKKSILARNPEKVRTPEKAVELLNSEDRPKNKMKEALSPVKIESGTDALRRRIEEALMKAAGS